ncbi:MAG: GntR family transcriptional regulator [Anaerolineae bacterium]|nr:GntR family transcriptional regulator [Anaerolineae bacterium]
MSQIKVDRTLNIPIYQQLEDQLEKLIADGTWHLNEPLPSETVLANQLQISVMTVRQAMAQLVNKGLIFREKGRGTFIAPQPMDRHLQRLESFTEDMHARDLPPSSRILIHRIAPVAKTITKRLGVAPDQPVMYLKRLRLIEDRPVAVHDAYINRQDLDRASLERVGSLYVLLEQRGVQLAEAEETIEATAADAETAQLLNMPTGAPLLKVTRLTWDRNHVPVELVVALYRADFYRYAVRLRR